MAENAELPTLILDEIDTGVSGRIADEMGNVMQEMAEENMQLIVITHLAQVAGKEMIIIKCKNLILKEKPKPEFSHLIKKKNLQKLRNCFLEARLQMPQFFRQKNSCNKFCNENIVLETND